MHGHKNVYRSYDTWKFAFLKNFFFFFFFLFVGGGGEGLEGLFIITFGIVVLHIY